MSIVQRDKCRTYITVVSSNIVYIAQNTCHRRQTDKLRQSNQCSASQCKQTLRQNNSYATTSALW